MSAPRDVRTDAPVAPPRNVGRIVFAALRLVVAVAIVAAISGQLTRSLAYWDARGDDDIPGDLVNFFSYFTMQSNAVAAATLAIGAVLLLRRRGADPRWFAVLHLLVATYMVTTGIVYNLLLRSMPLDPGLAQPWSNEILHLVVPVYLLIDRLFAPGNRRLSFATVGVVVIYPIVWATYTLGRAPFIVDQSTDTPGWYPYPFLDPRLADGGYQSVMTWVVVLLSMIAVIGFLLLVVARVRGRLERRSRRSPGGLNGATSIDS